MSLYSFLQPGRIQSIVQSSGGGGSSESNLLGSYDGDGSASSVTISLPAGVSDKYDDIIIVATCRTDVAANVDGLRMRFSTGGTVDTGTNYRYRVEELGNFGTVTDDTEVGDTMIMGRYTVAGGTADAGRFGMVSCILSGALNASIQPSLIGDSWVFPATGEWRRDYIWGTWKNAAIIDALNFYSANTANFVAGTQIRIYGLPTQ